MVECVGVDADHGDALCDDPQRNETYKKRFEDRDEPKMKAAWRGSVPMQKGCGAFSTRASHVVTHRTTDLARPSLTSPSGREGVRLSVIWPKTRVGRQPTHTYDSARGRHDARQSSSHSNHLDMHGIACQYTQTTEQQTTERWRRRVGYGERCREPALDHKKG